MKDLEALKSRHPILEVARDLGLEVQHNRFRCPRPENHVHGDRTPSVTLWPERGNFKCWVCEDVKGDVIDLVRIVKGLGFTEAVASLEKREGHHMASKPVLPAGAAKYHAGHVDSRAQTELLSEPKKSSALDEPAIPEAENRIELLKALLELSEGIKGKASAWLRGRRIFKKTWESQHLRYVENYSRVSEGLRAKFSLSQLQAGGLFNPDGHLRYYRHPLLLPYFDSLGQPVYLQARAIDPDVKPKELSLSGAIPCPYNASLLDGQDGILYLCEGVVDTLTLLEAGFHAVGIPGAANFKALWVPLFRHKSVYVAFDADAAGEAGAAKVMALLMEQGIEAHRVKIPAGKDINDWLRGAR